MIKFDTERYKLFAKTQRFTTNYLLSGIRDVTLFTNRHLFPVTGRYVTYHHRHHQREYPEAGLTAITRMLYNTVLLLSFNSRTFTGYIEFFIFLLWLSSTSMFIIRMHCKAYELRSSFTLP